MFSALNQITAHLERPRYKQEVGGSWPSAPTTPSTTYEPSGSPDTLPEAALRSDSVPYLCPGIDLGNSTPLPLPLRGLVQERQTPIDEIGWHCAKTPGSRNKNTGTYTTNSKAAVGLGAHWFPGEWPAGDSPLICGGRHPFGCLGLRAGCASLHRSKWRQGSTAEKIPNGMRGADNPRTGINQAESDQGTRGWHTAGGAR